MVVHLLSMHLLFLAQTWLTNSLKYYDKKLCYSLTCLKIKCILHDRETKSCINKIRLRANKSVLVDAVGCDSNMERVLIFYSFLSVENIVSWKLVIAYVSLTISIQVMSLLYELSEISARRAIKY